MSIFGSGGGSSMGMPIPAQPWMQPQQQQGGGGFNGSSILDFLKSNGGSSLISSILGGIGNMGQAKANERMFNQNQGFNLQQGVMDDLYRRDASLAQQAPTGWAQDYQQDTLMKQMMLQRLMNGGGGLTPANQDIASRLSPRAALTIPEEWQKVNPFGVDQSMQAIGQRQGVLDLLSGGRGPGMDFAALGYDPAKAATLNQQTGDFRNFAGQDYASRIAPGGQGQGYGAQAQQQQIPEGYEIDDKTGELKKKGSGFWGKLGKGLLIGGSALATGLTGGAASPLLLASLGVGTGAALGAMNGGGWKGALMGGAMGAIPGVGGALGKGAGNLGKTLLNTGLQQGVGALGRAIGGGGQQQMPNNIPGIAGPVFNQQSQNPYAAMMPRPNTGGPFSQNGDANFEERVRQMLGVAPSEWELQKLKQASLPPRNIMPIQGSNPLLEAINRPVMY